MKQLSFRIMNGTGNRFVVVDARKDKFAPAPEQVRSLCDSGNPQTKGCDQLIVIEPSQKADAFMRIYNADGGEVDACGNATRCVGWLLARETGRKAVTLETNAGILSCEDASGEGRPAARVDMGAPRLSWQEIPLAHAFEDTSDLGPIFENEHLNDPLFVGLPNPSAVSMGNPHIVFFMPFFPSDLAQIGASLEKHTALFPEGVNVGFAQVVTPNMIQLRVWERGAGETLACGTGACAAVVAAHRRGLLVERGEPVSVLFMGGGPDAPKDRILHIAWQPDGEKPGHVLMEGAVEDEREGSAAL